MKTILFFITTSILLSGNLLAQNCESYYLTKSGSSMTLKQFNAKGKYQGSSKSTILDTKPLAAGMEMTVKAESADEKDKPLSSTTFNVKCENNEVFIDMRNFVPSDQMAAYKDMELKISGDLIELPSDLSAGQSLKDGHMTMEMWSGEMKVMTMKFDITNRQVEAIEDKTTPAGTFSCARISYDIDMKVMFNVHLHVVDWVAKNVGTVRSESYNKEKLQGYSELSELKN